MESIPHFSLFVVIMGVVITVLLVHEDFLKGKGFIVIHQTYSRLAALSLLIGITSGYHFGFSYYIALFGSIALVLIFVGVLTNLVRDPVE